MRPSDKRFGTLVHLAAEYGSDEVIKLLTNTGIDINELDSEKDTALETACINENIDVAKSLLKNGANPNYVGSDGDVLLRFAVEERNFELTKLLLKYGARTDIPSKGKPIESFCEKGSEIFRLLKQYESNNK